MERGDFQTPPELAARVCRFLRDTGLSPRSIIEPTCGEGNLLLAAAEAFPLAERIVAAELDWAYVQRLAAKVQQRSDRSRFEVLHGNMLDPHFASRVLDRALPAPWLVIGNPPWVTNAAVTTLQGTNLPPKSNLDRSRGVAAVTGQSNFDISEWILRVCAISVAGQVGTMAMLCKSSVARRVLASLWRDEQPLRRARVLGLDSGQAFGVSVDACLLVCEFGGGPATRDAEQYAGWEEDSLITRWGWRDGRLMADGNRWERTREWCVPSPLSSRRWRSGIKHDCAAVLELRHAGPHFRNGLGDIVRVEPQCLYPWLKSSDVAHGRTQEPRRWLLLPQRRTGEDTSWLMRQCPSAWEYLLAHGKRLDRRRSRIYRDRPRFAVFGVGEYSFAPWKVAISGFYKQLRFEVVGRYEQRPMLLDDTCYFWPCTSREEAQVMLDVLHGVTAQDFLAARIFWDAKRPVNAELLNQLDLPRLLDAERA